MNKGFINIISIIAIAAILLSSFTLYSIKEKNLGASISLTQLTDTLGTFRTNVNTSLANLNAAITNSTSSLGNISLLASTTGNLIVGSSTLWRAMTVGTNGKALTASSTAIGGLSWEAVAGAIASLNGSVSSTQTFSSANTLLNIGTANGVHTFTATTTPTFTNITASGITSSTNAFFLTATTTNLHFSDATKQTTAFKETGFNVLNATTTATATTTIQKLFYQAITISQVDCMTNGANATIGMDIRASSTPETAGTIIASSMVCDSNGFSTSTFTNSNLSLQILNTDIKSLANSTTSIRVFVRYKEQ